MNASQSHKDLIRSNFLNLSEVSIDDKQMSHFILADKEQILAIQDLENIFGMIVVI